MRAHDSAVHSLPDDLGGLFTLCATPLDAAEDATALVIETDWPVYRAVDAERLVAVMRTPNVVDANGFLLETLGRLDAVRYIRVGTRGA